MTVDQYNEKCLLDYRCDLEGMISANRRAEVLKIEPPYTEQHFFQTQQSYNEALNRY